ncbi:MAG: hypothetical protein ACE5IJ_06830 [Thermoplasmata archaeon]
MLVIWKANFGGTSEQLEMVKGKMEEMARESGEKIDGPYYAQDADLLWLFWTKTSNIGLGGRDFLPWVQENKIPIEPVSWEIGVTEKEFWG